MLAVLTACGAPSSPAPGPSEPEVYELEHRSLNGCVAAYYSLDASRCQPHGPMLEGGAVGCDNGTYTLGHADGGRTAYLEGSPVADFEPTAEHGRWWVAFTDGAQGTCDVLAGELAVSR